MDGVGILLVIVLLVIAFLIGLRIMLRPGGRPPRGSGGPPEQRPNDAGDDSAEPREPF